MTDTFNSPENNHLELLKHQLLRNEQFYFEQLDKQASELEEALRELNKIQCQVQKLGLRELQLRQAQEELINSHEMLSLRDLQLRQAQEELTVSLKLQSQLDSWHYQLTQSLKSQSKLLLKTIALRVVDKLRWMIPIGFLRKNKAWIKDLLVR